MKKLKIISVLIIALVVILLFIGMKEIKTEVVIQGTANDVWNVLLNFEGHPEWNPFITSINGNAVVGEKLSVTVQPPDGKPMTFKPEVLVVDENKELRWIGKPGGIPHIASGEHYFILEQVSESEVKLVHGENFSGILVPFMGSLWENTEKGFELMNQALKERVESI